MLSEQPRSSLTGSVRIVFSRLPYTLSWHVIIVENGEAQKGEIEAIGLGCDVSNEASVKQVFDTVKERFGRLDAVVTAAGIVENFVAHEYPTEKIKKLLDINVMGTWYCALEAAKLMPEGGSITLVASMSGSVSLFTHRTWSLLIR